MCLNYKHNLLRPVSRLLWAGTQLDNQFWIDHLIDICLKLLLTSILPLADIAKIPVKNFIFKRWLCRVFQERLHSQQERLFTVIFWKFNFLGNLCNVCKRENRCQTVTSKSHLLDWSFLSYNDLFKENCLVGYFVIVITLVKTVKIRKKEKKLNETIKEIKK